MSRSVNKQPRALVAAVLFLGSASVAVATSIALPGLRDFDWAQDARAGRELIRWFAQLSGAGSDILPAGILFILPVFAARWLLQRPGKTKSSEQAWEERHRKPSIARALMGLAAELALLVLISAVMGVLLAYYLAESVLPSAALTPSFVLDAAIAIVVASAIYFMMVRTIDGLNLVDGAAALTFCGAAATFSEALASVSPIQVSSLGDMDPRLAQALLLSAIAVPFVIIVLRAQRRFTVAISSKMSRDMWFASRKTLPTMPFRLVPPETLRLSVGIFLWSVTGAMVAAAAIGHIDVNLPHALDWLLFPLPPALIAVIFYWLATRRLAIDAHVIAAALQRQNTYLPGCRPGRQTEEYLNFAFRRMLAAAAFFAGAISALVAALFWLSGSSPLQSLQGLAWIWTIGASGAALLSAIDARTASSLLPRMRWTPARAQFTLLCVTALIDRELAHEEEREAMALGARTKTLHEVDSETLNRWLSEIEAKKKDHEALIDLADRAIEDYPRDKDMRRAIYAQCADIAYADRSLKAREYRFLRLLAKGLRLENPDRKLIDAVILSKNRH